MKNIYTYYNCNKYIVE